LHPATANLQASELSASAERLRDRLKRLKRENPRDFDWYPYDSFANVRQLERLLGTRHEFLLEAARSRGVLDIGCADGELSFLFESLGCRVTAIDHPITNHNGMRGVNALKELLGSSVEIVETELDEQFSLPPEPRGLTLFLGILYHLKNPFQAMERLAKHAGYCLLSTRVARCFPDASPMPKGQPIAYLVDSDELNDDDSNYWIFSGAGLDRLLRRTRWEVLESFSTGETAKSDPVNQRRDERIFCLLKSHYGLANVELVDGWHEIEGAGWRWTRQKFSLRASFESEAKPERISIRMFISPDAFGRLGPVTLSGAVNGQPLRPFRMNHPGHHTLAARFRSSADAPLFTFELDKYTPPGLDEPRELGIVVSSIDVE
jgi:SAM-dependent methyltransferase